MSNFIPLHEKQFNYSVLKSCCFINHTNTFSHFKNDSFSEYLYHEYIELLTSTDNVSQYILCNGHNIIEYSYYLIFIKG